MIYRIFPDPAKPEMTVTPAGEYVHLVLGNPDLAPAVVDIDDVCKHMPHAVLVQKTAMIYLCEDGIRVEF